MASEPQSTSSFRWSNNWERVDQLLQSALEREPSQRVAFLREACGNHELLLMEVLSLLTSFEKAGDFMENPALPVPEMAAVLRLHDAGTGLNAGTTADFTRPGEKRRKHRTGRKR